MKTIRFFLLLGLMLVGTGSYASEFRAFRAIASPAGLPDGAQVAETLQPVNQDIVRDALEDMADAYGKPELEEFLAEEFFDKQRLMDAIDENVPQDVNLRMLSIRGVQTLDQYTVPQPSGNGNIRVSTVTATAAMNLEFNSPVNGFQRIPSTVEFFLRVREPI